MFNLKTSITNQFSLNRSSLVRTSWLLFVGVMLIFSCRKPSWNLSLKPEIISINAEVIDSSTVQLSIKNNPSIPVERGFVYVDQNKIDDNSIVFNLNKISNDSLSVYTSNLPLGKYYYLIELENEIGKTLSIIDSFILNDNGQLNGYISSLDCDSATNNGTLTEGEAADGVSSILSYSGGNGGAHNGQIVTSTGVTGLTLTIPPNSFSNGSGSLSCFITGTPSAEGIANFALNIGGQGCTLMRTVTTAQPLYPAGSVFCSSGPSVVIDVVNPITGDTWMDRNLGASQAATSNTDQDAYGDLYQWGRRSDGHQCRSSPTSTTLSSVDQPANGNFILATNAPYDWRSPQNTNLWQGVNGVNNPCPSGYRLPSYAELNAERLSWSNNNAVGAFDSPLKLPMAGYRNSSFGSLYNVGTNGYYWSSTVSSTNSRFLFFYSSNASMGVDYRAGGGSVRCLKD